VSTRQAILEWWERGAIADARSALSAAGVLPDKLAWRAFLDRLLLWSAAVALAAAVVFFIAYNWHELGKAAKFGLAQVLIVAAVLAYWKLRPDSAAGKAALLVAAVLLGALLALYGQTYQTGADTWELFANWAALILPWVLVGRFAGLWILWLALLNIAVALYYQVFPGHLGFLFAQEIELWTLFALDTAALALWELSARRWAWLDERWAPRLLAIASGSAITALVLDAIFDWDRNAGIAPVVAYAAWLACAHAAYRRRVSDVFVLAGACLSIIVVVAAFLAKQLHDTHEAAAYLFIALVVVGMGAASGWWLKQVAREAPA
jgi:uncharacterized membrane protein